ncbi:DUF922 domain-containing protein [Rhizobium sp. KVB221]|uniref:DUF922 domain-containing protein n=1 Tax=Rhizobium setariae TaxID=2801340 RepID=A0A936YWH1_9HYPH|nr:DUF922 domain-containing protein [Rhizobium setariae]MBL0375042.1 DUF922 domain-containing protein [Rhizobium setariae]
MTQSNLFRRSAKLSLLLCLAACLCVPTNSSAETIIRKTTSYFSIGGRTAADLDREMSRRGPRSKTTGLHHPGVTEIRFAGAATFVTKGHSCRVGGAKVTLSTKLMLPRWKNRRKADPTLALAWDTLSSDIKRHEERHAEIARNHARKLEREILALAPARDCATLKAKVNKISQKVMDDHDKDQQRFDRIETANFENRMMRLLKYRIASNPSE